MQWQRQHQQQQQQLRHRLQLYRQGPLQHKQVTRLHLQALQQPKLV
jgi:hypothetical protein